jgi:hypothetical protein
VVPQRAIERDVERDVPGQAHAVSHGRRGQGIERRPADAGMDLEEVVAGRLLLGDQPLRRGPVRHAVAVERWARRDESRPQHVAAGECRAQLEVTRMTEHAAESW